MSHVQLFELARLCFACFLVELIATGCSIAGCAGLDPSLTALLGDAMHCSWLATDGLGADHAVKTLDGTLTGTSPADLLYGLMMSCCVDRVTCLLNSAGAIQPMDLFDTSSPIVGSHASFGVSSASLPDISHVDDHAAIKFASSPAQLLASMPVTLDAVLSDFTSMHLRISILPGKSEAIAHFRGRGSTEARGVLNIDNAGYAAFPCGRQLRVVRQYRHTGAATTQSGSLASEVAARIKSAKGALAPLCRRAFCSHHIGFQAKSHLLASPCLSRLLVCAGAWSPVPASLLQRLHATYMYLVRTIARARRGPDSQSLTDVQVLEACSFNSVLGILRQQKAQACCSAGSWHAALTQAPSSYF